MKQNSTEMIQKINGTLNVTDQIYHQAARKLGVSDSELCILYVIYEKGDGCRLFDVCMESGIRKQTINSAVRKLEQQGILYLKQGQGKTKKVCLTELGKDYVTETAGCLYHAECQALQNWSDEDVEQYLYYMKKYNEDLQVQIDQMTERKHR